MTAPLTPKERVEAAIYNDIGGEKVVSANVAYELAAELEEANKLFEQVQDDLNVERLRAVDNCKRAETVKLLAEKRAEAAERQLAEQDIKIAELRSAINSPEIHDFVKAVQLEAIHQRQRWGTEHDTGKTPEDWLWLVAYLATKASQAYRYGDNDKYLHHIITCAAACLNWHTNATGANTAMRAGVDPEKYGELE